MDAQTLINQVKSGQAEAQATAAKMGPNATPVLIRLSEDENPAVRLQALICLQITGGAGAAETALKHLKDEDEQVSGQALQILQTHPPQGKGRELLNIYRETDDAFLKQQLPLIAGRVDSKFTSSAWKDIWLVHRTGAPDSVAERNLLASLARMGDMDARRIFTERLRTIKAEEAEEWIELCKYMQDTWVLPGMAPLLDRQEIAFDLAPDLPNTLPMRIADITAEAIFSLSRVQVGFEVQRITQFTPQEIDVARKIAVGIR